MGQIRLPGLLTGIDTAAIIKQLMIINSRRLATYQVQKINYGTKTTAINELRSKVSSLKSAAGALSSAEKLETFNVSTSDSDILTASATSDANPGSHSVEIDQLATGETWIQDTSTFSYKTDYVGGGTFIYSYNAKESIITTVADETTLEDFVNLINNAADNPGVTASLLYHGGKYHMMLSGQETGTDHQISINAGSTEVWKPDVEEPYHTFTDDGENAVLTTKIIELDQFGSNPLEGGEVDEVIEITGTDYYNNDITQLDLSLTNNTTLGHLIDKINEAFHGNVIATLVAGKIVVTDSVPGDGSTNSSDLSIALNYNPDGSAATLDLPTMAVSTADTGNSTIADLTSFAPGTFIETQDAQDSKIKIDGYPSVSPVSEVQTMTLSSIATGGQIYLTYKGETTASIPYTADATDIQDALELLPNVNTDDITVFIAGDGTIDSDPKQDIVFTFRNTFGDVPMILVKNELTGPGTPTVTMTETKGVSEWISKNSNSLSDILEGVTLNLQDVTPASNPVEITLSRNTTAVSNKITQMVGAYNSLISFLAEKTEYNSETKKMGILSDDIAVSFIKTQANNPIIGIVPGFTDTIDTLIQAFDIGITLDGAGKMKFNTSTFNDAIEEDFMGVLELLGADGTGNSDGDIIKFYAASNKYTTAGTYDVKVVVEDVEGENWITSAKIKLSSESESEYRDATWPGGLVTGNSEFGDNGPLYPENGLQLTVDLSDEGTFTETVRVKQGFAGALEDLLTEIIKTDGRLDISEDIVEDRITDIESTIRREEDRLEMIETRLIEKFARLEKTLAMLQQQMSAVSVVSQLTFGSSF